MESIEVDAMNDSVPVLTWEATVPGLCAEEEDERTLQDSQDIFLFVYLVESKMKKSSSAIGETPG